ncbi:MAG: hypothetical protein JXA43_02880, partial [Candidatus Diapherotrites archaeon]|nr:hypothetical protein [Candidatus Diapherotrites archaeon]
MNERGLASLIIILIVIAVVAVGAVGYAVMTGMLGGQGLGKDVLFKKLTYEAQKSSTGVSFVIDKAGMTTVVNLADELSDSVPMTSDQEAAYESIKTTTGKVSLLGMMVDQSSHANIYAVYSEAKSPQQVIDEMNTSLTDIGEKMDSPAPDLIAVSTGKIGSFDYAVIAPKDDSSSTYVSVATRGNEILFAFPDDEEGTAISEFVTVIDSGPSASLDSEIEAEVGKSQILFYGQSSAGYSGVTEGYGFLSQSGEDNYTLSLFAEMDADDCTDAKASLDDMK